MVNNTELECGMLIGIEPVMQQFATCHPTDGMDEILTVQVVEPILIGIMSIGPPVEIMSGRVFYTILIMSILRKVSVHV